MCVADSTNALAVNYGCSKQCSARACGKYTHSFTTHLSLRRSYGREHVCIIFTHCDYSSPELAGQIAQHRIGSASSAVFCVIIVVCVAHESVLRLPGRVAAFFKSANAQLISQRLFFIDSDFAEIGHPAIDAEFAKIEALAKASLLVISRAYMMQSLKPFPCDKFKDTIIGGLGFEEGEVVVQLAAKSRDCVLAHCS